jgi:Tol biopolymer transport system component
MKSAPVFNMLIMLTSCSRHIPLSHEKYTIEQFYGNTRVFGGYFSPDESRLLFSSDKTGIFNLFEVEIATGNIKQVTHSTGESYFAVGYVTGRGKILFSADQGGGEYFRSDQLVADPQIDTFLLGISPKITI